MNVKRSPLSKNLCVVDILEGMEYKAELIETIFLLMALEVSVKGQEMYRRFKLSSQETVIGLEKERGKKQFKQYAGNLHIAFW